MLNILSCAYWPLTYSLWSSHLFGNFIILNPQVGGVPDVTDIRRSWVWPRSCHSPATWAGGVCGASVRVSFLFCEIGIKSVFPTEECCELVSIQHSSANKNSRWAGQLLLSSIPSPLSLWGRQAPQWLQFLTVSSSEAMPFPPKEGMLDTYVKKSIGRKTGMICNTIFTLIGFFSLPLFPFPLP